MTPSGTISCACWAAEPCQTPSERVALPLTAAASGTVQSTRIWPGSSASRRLLRFSDWARKGTVRKTISPRFAASSLTQPLDLGAGDRLADPRRRLLGALGRARADHDRRRPACAQRSARPAPRAPVPPMIGIGSASRRGASLVAPVYAAARDEARGTKGAGHRRRQRDRRGDRAPPRRRGRRGLGRRRRRARAPRGSRREIAGHRAALDVTDLDSAQAAVEATGTLDILVNNAGTDEFGFFTDTTPEQWQRVLGGQPRAASSTAPHAALPGMQQAGYGRIVSISSEAGRVGSKGSAVYSAAKGGVIAFMKAIARENARYGITANSIAPGPIETPLLMGAEEFGEIGEKIIETMKAATQMRPPRPARRGRRRGRLPRLRRRLLRHRRDARGQRRPRDGLMTALEPGIERSDEFVGRGPAADRRRRHDRRPRALDPGDDRDDGAQHRDPRLRAPAEGKATVGFEVCVKHVAAAAEGASCTVRSSSARSSTAASSASTSRSPRASARSGSAPTSARVIDVGAAEAGADRALSCRSRGPDPRGRAARRLPERARGDPDRGQGAADRHALGERAGAARGDLVRAPRRDPAARRRRGGAGGDRAPRGVAFSVLIPNERGLERALELRDRFDEVNLFLSASETHNRKNVNRSIEESLAGLERTIDRARGEGLRCEGVISVSFGCPYEGEVPPERVFEIAERLAAAGCEEVGFGDTTGMANPRQVARVLRRRARAARPGSS